MKPPWEQDTDRYPRAWVRWAIFVLWALCISFCVSIILVACSDRNGPGDDESVMVQKAMDTGAWFDITDEVTGRSFRCVMWSASAHYARGISSFCYEPFTGAGE